MVSKHLGWSTIAIRTAAIGTVLTFNQGAIAATPAVPSVLKVLPSDTAAVMLLNAEAQAWEKLAQFPLFGPEITVPGFMFSPLLAQDLSQLALGKPKRPMAVLNFDIDVLPWLGDRVAYAMLPDGNPIAIAAVKDPSKTQAYLTRLQNSRSRKPTLLTYNNAQIIAWAPEPIKTKLPEPSPEKSEAPATPQKPKMTQGFALAYLPGTQSHIMIAPTVDVLKNLLDRQKNTSLSQNPDFQKTIADPRFASALAVGFGDYQAFVASSKKTMEASPLGAPFPVLQMSGVLKQIEDGYGNINAFLTATNQGMQFEGNLKLKPTIAPEALALLKSTDTKNEILKRLPAVTYGFANSNNLAFPMGQVFAAYEQDKQLKIFLDTARKFSQNFLGIDDRDILPWMDREYVMFAFPTQQGFFAKQLQTDIGMGLLIQTSDRKKAETGLKKIQASMVQRLGKGIKVAPRTVNNTTFTSINTPDDKSLFAYSWVSEDTVLLVTGAESADRLVPTPWQPLTNSSTFKEAIAPLPKDNAGYFYIDGSTTAAFVFNSLLPKFVGPAPENAPSDELRRQGSSIRHVVGTSIVRQDSIQVQTLMQLGSGPRSPITAKALLEKYRPTSQYEGNSSQKIQALSRAIVLDPNLSEAYFQRGLIRLSDEDYLGALGDLNEASSRNFKSPLFPQAKGIAHYNLHDYEKAIAELKLVQAAEASFFADDSKDLLFNAYMQVGDYKPALALVNQQLEDYGSLVANLFQRCDVKARMGDFKEALEDCEAGLTALREVNEEQQKDFEKQIIADLKAKVITQEEAESQRQNSPTPSPPSLAQRCYVRAALGVSTALQECEALIEKDAENARAFEYLGLGRAALKQSGNARQAYQQAIALYEAMDNQVAAQRVAALLKQLPQ